MNQVEIFKKIQKSPLFFIKLMWHLRPQEKGEKFVKGKHVTRQQIKFLKAVEKAVTGKGKKRISVRSGHGTGKDCTLAWLILWYLFSYRESQIPCTAPTSDQIYDVLWKEIAKWHKRMPEAVQGKYQITSDYARITESPETWFARARTGRKENPEALAGVHGDFVFIVADEASGVPDEIYNTMEGALTGEDVLIVLVSNPTRLNGYFYDTHHKDKKNWQTLHFNSEDSPIVDDTYVNRIVDKHGADSDEYRIRVLGEFPREDSMDDKGYVALFNEKDFHIVEEAEFIGEKRLGIDPAGDGDNKSVWVLRDEFRAEIVATEVASTPKSIAQKTLTLMDFYGVKDSHVYVDNFGVGANVLQELGLAGKAVNGVNVGDRPFDTENYLNLRAEAFWKLKQWIRQGAELVDNKGWDELLTIKYRRELNNKLKIMSKIDMKKEGFESPDNADALMLTFTRPPHSRHKKRVYTPNNPIIGL